MTLLSRDPLLEKYTRPCERILGQEC
ncbi:hypothetical protein CCACVL1_20060 [Corchorus capsularis]|uniref:Uncharacterized protein n=1 Tax=Corchorus capsularis TaxID=210143 RepID=A0A1R3HCT2_COCAP|nr:hypothetical protein CCACVL1_20060 [Corchorus capsularis]